MKKTALITIALMVAAFASAGARAQINIRLPDIKINRPDPDRTRNNTPETTRTNTTKPVKTSGSKLIYPPQMPTNVPVLLKNSVYVEALTRDEYWKMPGQRNYSSWIPKIRFNQYYNEEKRLNYAVEYFTPNGSPWFTQQLESNGRKADRTVLYESVESNDDFNTKATNQTGVFSFKITDRDSRQVVFQGKFKLAKYSRANRPDEKNKAGFYVDHEWLLQFAMLGFHHSLDEVGGMPPLVSFWLKGDVSASDLEGRIFYQGRQIASTKDEGAGGASDYDERMSDMAPAFAPDKRWKRWQFQFANFLVDNNGSFNRGEYPKAFYADKNPGEYTVKIYLGGAQIREVSFAVGADGRFVAPSWTGEIPLPYYRLVLPAKVLGPESRDAAASKADAFYGNPLTGF